MHRKGCVVSLEPVYMAEDLITIVSGGINRSQGDSSLVARP
jgi:hypothetical protein